MTNPANPFGEFEAEFKDVKAAPPGSFPGRIPEGTYKFILTTDDPSGDGVLVDHQVFVAKNTGTKGFKLFCEVFEPASVMNPSTKELQQTKGEVLEHPFWVTKKNLPYMCRDLSTIAGREISGPDVSSGAILKMAWAGRTFEGVVGDEKGLDGVTRSRIKYINPWTPKKEAGPNPHGVAGSGKNAADPKKPDPKPDPKAETKKVDQNPAPQGAGKGGDLEF